MKEIVLEINRFNGVNSFVQDYRLTYQPNKTFLWWLTRINEEMDASLTFPGSCRAGLCGGCGVLINGNSVLACETPLDPVLDYGFGKTRISPLQGFPVIRDLLIDWQPVMERHKEVCPWLNREHDMMLDFNGRQSQAEFNEIRGLASCVTCGICASECPIMAGGRFLEPFVFVKAQRLIIDSRLSVENRQLIVQSLQAYLPHCIQCGRCKDACPKGISPAAAILFLQKQGKNIYFYRKESGYV